MKTLIKNGNIVTKTEILKGYDALIEGDKIVKLGKNITDKAEKIIDASGKTVYTSFTDMHVHLREPGFEHKETIETGAKAAAVGGYGIICCMPNTNPANDNVTTTEYIVNKAKNVGYTRVYPIGAITKGLKGEELAEIGRMKRAGAIAISDDGCPVSNGNVMRLALEYAKGHDVLVISHCEDKTISEGGVVNEGFNSTQVGLRGINRVAEEVMTARECQLAAALKTKVHIAHVSTKGSVELMKMYKGLGVNVTAETCPHYFALTDDEILTFDTATKVNPPLRVESDRIAIIDGLVKGFIDVISTDHAPHHADDKNVEFNYAAFGISGIESAYSVANTVLVKGGYVDEIKLNKLLSLRAREILGLECDGIRVGGTADLVICDGNAEYVLNSKKFISKGKNTPFNGKKLIGKVLCNIVGGKILVENGELV